MGELVRSIDVDVAIGDLRSQIKAIRRKTNTLIDYYIYPDPTPSQIGAYDPRLVKLDTRLAALENINYKAISALLDDSDALAASWLIDIIGDLLNAVHGIAELFVNHYDPKLDQRQPYGTIYELLIFREQQLKATLDLQMRDLHRKKPEDKRDSEVGHICRGAIQMINGRDRGEIAHVADRDLLKENYARLQEYHGAYLWWKCTSCDFKLRYHLSHSNHSSIHSTDEVRTHPDVKAEYKSEFLVKSHLYKPKQRDSSRSRNSRSSPSASSSKYACIFCLTQGSKQNFLTGRSLATHIAANHRGSKKQPPAMILQKFRVAVKGRKPNGVHRWDINLT